MGIILIPFLLLAIGIACFALGMTIFYAMEKKITIKVIIAGLLTAIVIFTLICLHYAHNQETGVFGPIFTFVIYMVIIPFALYVMLQISRIQVLQFIAKILLIEVLVAAICLPIGYNSIQALLMNQIGVHIIY